MQQDSPRLYSSPMKNILIVSDAASPQVNGVVRTIETTIKVLENNGWRVKLIHPGMFKTMPTPGYAEIPMVISTKGLAAEMVNFQPDFVHIATEGRLGWAARKLCRQWGWRFTTAYHTDFPGYLRKHFHVPLAVTFRAMRAFHSASSAIMVATPTVEQQLRARGFDRIVRWSRGVDMSQFIARTSEYDENDEPILLSVGRVSKEKNLEVFFNLDVPGMKIVVGDGPMLETYREQYPDVVFMGKMTGQALASIYAMADVFVFPSVTDTFGLVIIEALAAGTPVAAYAVQGPIDILCGDSGRIGPDLAANVTAALKLEREGVARVGRKFTWERATAQFVSGLVPR
jgi:glycosyltransferase involved in cell wall biosynthesis